MLICMKNYNSTIYNEKERPVTSYPDELARYLLERFHIKTGSRILDNGCGRGDFYRGFAHCGMEVYGTDMEEVFDDVYSGINLEKDRLPFADNYFDHVQPCTMVGLRDTIKMFGFKNVSSELFYQLPCVWRYPQIK